MILTDDSHEYLCTDCTHTGRPCMEGLWLAKRLTAALAGRAEGLFGTGGDFACSARFLGCGRVCTTLLRVRRTDVQIYCGVAPEHALAEMTGEATEARAMPAATVIASPQRRPEPLQLAAE